MQKRNSISSYEILNESIREGGIIYTGELKCLDRAARPLIERGLTPEPRHPHLHSLLFLLRGRIAELLSVEGRSERIRANISAYRSKSPERERGALCPLRRKDRNVTPKRNYETCLYGVKKEPIGSGL